MYFTNSQIKQIRQEAVLGRIEYAKILKDAKLLKDTKIIAKKTDVEEEIKQPKYIYKKDIQFIFLKKNDIELVFKLLCNQ